MAQALVAADAEPGQGGLGELGGVLGDLDPAVGTGQHRAYRHGQDRGQLVAFPAAAAVIEDAVQGGQQPAAGGEGEQEARRSSPTPVRF
jgi:hypothetical protein